MDFDSWEPVYLEILDDFGFSREEDERSALILSRMLEEKGSGDLHQLEELLDGKDVLVCGNAPGLPEDLASLDLNDYVIITADGATAVVMSSGAVPDIIGTDLDGDVDSEIQANHQGAVIVVHAHGDNIDKLEEYVPVLNNIIGSTQSKPLDNVHNFGGFTDGDRCVFLATRFNAASVTLAGFDFEDVNVTPMKKKKLKWAKRLIDMAFAGKL